jgi:hypothetical protein
MYKYEIVLVRVNKHGVTFQGYVISEELTVGMN